MSISDTSKIEFNASKILKELNNLGFDFYVAGGIICQLYLKEHSRFTSDVDLVTGLNLKEVEKVFKNSFDISDFDINLISPKFFEETFSTMIAINKEQFHVEGIKLDCFKEIKPVLYQIDDVTFKGVPIEFIVAEKIISSISELKRPYKHLVDLYSFSLLEDNVLDKKEIKRYCNLINDNENKVRKSLNLKERELTFKIPDNKGFDGSIFVPTLQAKHNVSKEFMIKKVNEFLDIIKKI